MEPCDLELRKRGADQFLAFVEYATSVIAPNLEEEEEEEEEEEKEEEEEGFAKSVTGFSARSPGWSWIVSRILKTCMSYSSGVTAAILLSDLCQAWSEQCMFKAHGKRPEIVHQLKKKNKRTKLPNTVTIDSIYEKNFLSFGSILEVIIVNVFVLQGTNIYMLTLADFWSSNTIDLYLHRRYYDLVGPHNGVLKKGRELFLTGCYVRTREGFGCPRLLPTEYLVILLDDDQDDDAMLIAAQFCSDSFSSISLNDANNGVSYSLYSRIESIGLAEVQERKSNGVQSKQVVLVDNDGNKLNFFLWGEQVLLANLFSTGSMLALDRPYISTGIGCELCLEYGSATQLYLVPLTQHEEQVLVPMAPSHSQAPSTMTAEEITQGVKVSQVTLPCDSQGSVDFSGCPFRSRVIDLRDKMSGISLYGVVLDIFRDETSATEAVFSLKIEDGTASMWAKLRFAKLWSIGRIGHGHTIFISGLSCYTSKHNNLKLSWSETIAGASSIINISCLPALLNSSCLHQLSHLSDLSHEAAFTFICRVCVDQVERCSIQTRILHCVCGQVVSGASGCSLCRSNRNDEFVRTFHLEVTLADETGMADAWCLGQAAAEILQISPDEFYQLPEEEQFMYPSSLEKEKYIVALVNSRGGRSSSLRHSIANPPPTNAVPPSSWEVTCAMRCQ